MTTQETLGIMCVWSSGSHLTANITATARTTTLPCSYIESLRRLGRAGANRSVCVTVTVRIPLLPEFIDANTATGQFVVERDRYVDS
ncbi:hypothetical protein DQ239_12055 [Blastococcus sp. TF02-09]|nr:hypothetical protein DQ239_12055 [Blastococcus sp. TF02-9]